MRWAVSLISTTSRFSAGARFENVRAISASPLTTRLNRAFSADSAGASRRRTDRAMSSDSLTSVSKPASASLANSLPALASVFTGRLAADFRLAHRLPHHLASNQPTLTPACACDDTTANPSTTASAHHGRRAFLKSRIVGVPWVDLNFSAGLIRSSALRREDWRSSTKTRKSRDSRLLRDVTIQSPTAVHDRVAHVGGKRGLAPGP